jgi:hypothetical protein
MTLFSDIDHAYLLTDPSTLVIHGAEGGILNLPTLPFRHPSTAYDVS